MKGGFWPFSSNSAQVKKEGPDDTAPVPAPVPVPVPAPDQVGGKRRKSKKTKKTKKSKKCSKRKTSCKKK